MKQTNRLTLISTIDVKALTHVEALLLRMNDAIGKGVNGVEQLTTTHFARWFVLPPFSHHELGEFSAQLVFTANFDGGLEEYLTSLIDLDFTALTELFSHCGFSSTVDLAAGITNVLTKEKANQELLLFLLSLSRSDACFYTAHKNRSRAVIEQEKDLKRVIDDAVNECASLKYRRPLLKRPCEIGHIVETDKVSETDQEQRLKQTLIDIELTCDSVSQPIKFPLLRGMTYLYRKQAIILGAFLLTICAVLFTPIMGLASLVLLLSFLFILRKNEHSDPGSADAKGFSNDTDLSKTEDFITQNPMTSVTYIKPGIFRYCLLLTVLKFIHYLANTQFTQGWLGSISTIHFAHWIIIDNGRRLLFMSNFDGSWENYLGDFIDKATLGLTAIWSNTYGFPPTQFLVFGGARYEQQFKAYTRNSQLRTHYWYSAYPDLSCDTILNNSVIAKGLKTVTSGKKQRAWLKNL